MAEYWGLEEICKKMGWKDKSTPLRQFKNFSFPMLLRHRKGLRRSAWWTCDDLILRWFIAMAKLNREQLFRREKEPRNKPGRTRPRVQGRFVSLKNYVNEEK